VAGDQSRHQPGRPTRTDVYASISAARQGASLALDAKATAEYTRGEKAGSTSDNYVRTTVYLAPVLLLAGLGGHFGYRVIRYGLGAVGTVILGVAIVVLATSPRPP
jgi:ABC-type uncharacterized transport system permease subunit